MEKLVSILLYFLLLLPLIHPHGHHHHSGGHTHTHTPSKKEMFLSTTGLTAPLSTTNLPNLIRHFKHRKHAQKIDSIEELLIKLRLKSRQRRHNNIHNNATITELSKKLNNITWPLKKLSIIEGDIWLGGLMMVHEREDEIICGPIMPQGGVQALETMLYTIDYINNRSGEFLPGIKIGAHILDDCDKDTYGLEQAVDFIKGSISNIDSSIIDSSTCASAPESATKLHNVIAGVVGAASSVTSIQVANLLRLFRIPQVSFFSTSPELSNKQRFEFFSRTIPSDKNQVKVMVELLKTFGWTYVSIIYEESNYGIKAFEELEKLLPENNICIATKEKLVKDSGVAEEIIYERIVEKLLNTGKAKGVIVFGSDQEVKDLMKAVARKNATGHFSWIGSDGWSARTLVSDGNEAVVEGTLSVQPRAENVKGFKDYFLQLSPKTNHRNPWFVEFWENHFSCKYPNSSKTPYNQNYNSFCTGDEKLDRSIAFEDQLQYVSDAVMTFAYAFRDMHRNLCNGSWGLCSRMNPVDGTELLGYLRRVEFEGLSGDSFHFDEFQDGPARYNIIHFRRKDAHSYHWIRVGDYNEGELVLNMDEIRFPSDTSTPPVSVCSEPCVKGEAKQYFGGDKCCWSCIKCAGYFIVDPSDESECFECPLGTLPNEDHTSCSPIEESYLKPRDVWAIFSMTIGGIGLLLTTTIILIFIAHNETPVVRASSRELTYVILAGLFGCFALTFLFVVRPSHILCGVQLFSTGFIFTVVYSALLTKTNRIARIFKAGRKSAKRPSFISPKSQLVICGGVCSVQMLITTMWLLIDRPLATHFYPTRADNFLICSSYINHSYIVAFFYPLMIIFICTVYAVLTRKIPGDFNESKCIGFTMYTTCIIWLAFVPIYWSTGLQVSLRITSMTVAISLSAYVMIVCLFGPKLYIILFHPERNIRQSMMSTGPSQRVQNVSMATGTTKLEMGVVVKDKTNGLSSADKATQMEEMLMLGQQQQSTVNVGNVAVAIQQTQKETQNKQSVHPVNQTTQTEEMRNCDCSGHRFSFKKEKVAVENKHFSSGGGGDDEEREVIL